VSLDPSENDPTLFWAYVIRALQRVHPSLGQQAFARLHDPGTPALEPLLTTLLNDLSTADLACTLILDDYHVIDSGVVHESVTFLVDHMPPGMRLVLASRSDPPLPVARLRARGELTEIRIGDMRFTPDEASSFLNQVMALELSPADISRLAQRTEGWIAGLKLAALSMKGRENASAFVAAFSGNDRYVADYLVDEVLQAEPERTQRFLLGTAMLERLSGPLCDAVTGETGSQSLLESLEKRNLFVVPLDDQREWYRYHHLFAEVLQARALGNSPEEIRLAHASASAWFESQGAIAEAVHHALAAGDQERAARLLERSWPEKDRSHASARWLNRVKSLSDALIRARPLLSMGYAWGLLNSGELEAAEPRLQDVERWLAAHGAGGGSESGDEARLRNLPMELAAARVYLAQSRGDTPGTVEHAQRALDLIPEDDIQARPTGVALLALALWARGDLEEAHRTFADALAGMRRGGNELSAIRGIFVLGDIRVAQGRLREAATIYEGGLQAARLQELPGPAETDELLLGLAELHREWGDLEAATGYLVAMTESAPGAGHAGNRQRWCTAKARILEARGDLKGALLLLEEADSVERRDPLPRVRPVAAQQARLWIALGRPADALEWARERGLSARDELTFLREFEHVTLARALLSQGALPAALGLLERLTTAAEAGRRTGTVIETLALQALALHTTGDPRGALSRLERALTLAEPEGYLRVFVDEGVRMRDLLRQAAARGIAGEQTRRVLLGYEEAPKPVAPPSTMPGRATAPVLTARELEVLRLIAAGLRNQEIADQLSISSATVKRHIANTYTKLGVEHRTEALVRAKEMNLL